MQTLLLSQVPLRSEIDSIIETAAEIFRREGFHLPPFSRWSPREWSEAGPEWDTARQAKLGWDVTDFGLGKFSQIGRVLFTLRNGQKENSSKPYAEKIILGRHGQRAPLHYHKQKIEDIINRGGGDVVIHLEVSGTTEETVFVYRDGCEIPVTPNLHIRLLPGESLCIPSGVFHQFWGEETISGRIPLIGEVSSFCDDTSDNVFLEEISRFANVIDDVPPRFCLCHELPEFALSPLSPSLQAA